MLDPRLRLLPASPATLLPFLEQLIHTFITQLRRGRRLVRLKSGLLWREARLQLQREVWQPLQRVCAPAVITLRREVIALLLTVLALWQEGRAHLRDEVRALWWAVRRLVHRHPARPLWRTYSQRLQGRLSNVNSRLRVHAAQLGACISRGVAQGMQRVRAALPAPLAEILPAGRQLLEEQLADFGRTPAYVNVVSLMVVATYLSLALMSLAIVAFALPPLPPPVRPASPYQAQALSNPKRILQEYATLTPAPTSTPSPSATPEPTATPSPVPTATPIPVVYSIWESTLPQYGGWNGAGQCWGRVLAPIGTGTFIWPTDRHYLVGKNFSWRWHPGLDLGGEYDEPIYAADSGVVVYSGWNTYGYGNTVILDHGNGWHTLYAHFNSVLVTCGEAVTQGQIIGLAGSTGRSTGPHLHFEMRLGGGYVNPWNYLPPP
ncbi:MAG: peptidoglycan DD-metalloendopeptidase family protein [Anaerolineales bacterium]|nr:peptidoglycan DD-metalloendopeptidase family protein [Anaerolineales bacterium]